MIKILKENLGAAFDAVAKSYDLFLPVKTAGTTNFAPYEKGAEVDLNTLKTVKSAKDFFFPQSETMMKFRLSGKNISIQDVREEKKPFVIFGVRGCDVKSFDILDKVFLDEPIDTFYKARRDAAVIVSLACGSPELSCFCTNFGVDPANPCGNATAYLTENALYLRANDEKGEKLIKVLSDISAPAGENETEPVKKAIDEKVAKLPYKELDLSRFKPENLNELFELEEWKSLSEACLGCGTCTFVCPTCQCFDIRDFKTHSGVMRFRCWDSCMYKDFTQMAAANPRTTQAQRFRQRFMHKLVYYPSRYGGTYSCAGCGRCVNKCPQHLNILKVIKTIGDKKNGD